MDVVTLTKDLVKFNTINPPGNEEGIAKFVGEIFLEHGFDVDFQKHEVGRLNLIASRGLSETYQPIILTGHFDVVPLGAKDWSVDPFNSKIIDGKLFGRGTTDMKAGLAAMIVAVVESFNENSPKGGVKLILTADEELGCRGAKKLLTSNYDIGEASAIIVGEPTSNIPYISHKGGLFINAKTLGITAHSSMPELGENAIYKAADAITKIAKFSFDVEQDPLLGYPTINVGKISGGLNLNSVPDKAEFTIDVRSTTKLNNNSAFAILKKELGDGVLLEEYTNLDAISTSEENPFIQMVYKVCKEINNVEWSKKSVSYLTDAAVLTPWLGNVPTIILGPGEPEMSHQTDEFCYVNKIEEAVKIYKNIITNNGESY
ncbi:MAG: M20 family metallopeptidase [Melioribacteraceae bacterium]|nr:M20 family metallopeptidase [Melioribacteraceae bacterium]